MSELYIQNVIRSLKQLEIGHSACSCRLCNLQFQEFHAPDSCGQEYRHPFLFSA